MIYRYLNSAKAEDCSYSDFLVKKMNFSRKPQIFWRYFLPLNFSILKHNTVENYPHKPQKSYPKKEHKSDKY